MLDTLADELRRAIDLLRENSLHRAANRLEKLSREILAPSHPKKRAKTRRVQLVGGSGKAIPIRIAEHLIQDE